MPKQRSILVHPKAWILLTAGLCLTGVMFAFMWQSDRHTRKLVEANRTISELARTDPLTALANRRMFHDRMAWRSRMPSAAANPLPCLYIDLDHFKDFNDLMGHPAGDALLVQVGKRLLAEARDADCVARFGGDEFAILQSNAGAEGASEALAQKIVATLNELAVLEGHAARISASVGVSRYVEAMDGPDVVLMQADLALYRAKDAGRNRVCIHDETFGQLACDRVMLGRELVAAIEGGGLALQYQPQVDIETGRIVGLEALVRWNHPQRGPISPAVFIPLAEKTGSIVDLGKWVFDEACRQTRVWQDEGIDVPTVAVNLSAIQCKRPELEQDIVASLTRWNIAPDRIELELTESVLMEATATPSRHHRAPASARTETCDRRFRHRLFIAQLSYQFSGGPDQDCPGADLSIARRKSAVPRSFAPPFVLLKSWTPKCLRKASKMRSRHGSCRRLAANSRRAISSAARLTLPRPRPCCADGFIRPLELLAAPKTAVAV